MNNNQKHSDISTSIIHEQKISVQLSKRELSWIIAACCIIVGGMFLVGYMVGQKHAMDRFLYKIEEQSFADKITYSFYAMNGQDLPDDDEDVDGQAENMVNTKESIKSDDTCDENSALEQTENSIQTKEQEIISDDESIPSVLYYAPLVGYGTLRAADQCAQKLKKMGIDAHLVEKVSIGQRGKKVIWYQIVTEDYTDKDELEEVVQRIKQTLNIKLIKIAEKRKATHS